jgi:hypothetical protein
MLAGMNTGERKREERGAAMLQTPQIEELICLVSALDRRALTQQFMTFRGNRFPIDFTPEFLDRLSVDRMRHIFVALCLQHQHIPDMTEAAA